MSSSSIVLPQINYKNLENGSASAPSIAFASSTNTGMRWDGTYLHSQILGTSRFRLGATTTAINSTTTLIGSLTAFTNIGSGAALQVNGGTASSGTGSFSGLYCYYQAFSNAQSPYLGVSSTGSGGSNLLYLNSTSSTSATSNIFEGQGAYSTYFRNLSGRTTLTSSGYNVTLSSSTGGTYNGNYIILGLDGITPAQRADNLSYNTFGVQSRDALFPYFDNTYSLGWQGLRWANVWAANATIQTSDERTKKDIVDSPLGLDFIKKLRPVAYKYKIGTNVPPEKKFDEETGKEIETDEKPTPVEGKRQHFGLIAQEVQQAIGDVDFGGWLLTDVDDANSEQALRYDEFIAPLIKAIQEQQHQIEALKAEIETLKAQ